MRNEGFLIAISLDIKNAFNSIPWRIIRRTLKHKRYPEYICKILDSYLSNRTISYTDNNGTRCDCPMEAGVSQGSVLGSVLWNIAFDDVIRMAEKEEHCEIVCYADDTLTLISGRNLFHTKLGASIFTSRVINYIQNLGLEVATEKTEAIIFHPRRVSEDIRRFILINGTELQLTESIKYLGIYIDQKWTFREHFRYIEDKAEQVIRALSRLMPNLRGPDEKKRRLFANVVLGYTLRSVNMG